MRILIAGAAGQLGKELQEILLNNRCREGSLPSQFCNAEVIAATSSMLNVVDEEKVSAFLAEFKPQLVLNCAAYTAVDRAETEQALCISVNRDGGTLLATLCAQRNIRYVYPSSESVFGGEQTVPYTEASPTYPQNTYGKSKLAGEQAILRAYPEALIPRAGWLYGFFGRNFVKTIGSLAMNRDSLRVVNDQFGNPTNADVFCLRIFQLLDAEEHGVFHCVDRGVTTRFEYAQEIIRGLELPCAVQPCTTDEYPTPAPRSLYMGMDCTKLEKRLQIQQRDWQEVLIDYLKEAKQRGIFA